ncbi:MAG: hypothetical protein H8D94_01385 [Candidatus Pelagibacter sp.]|nr:hypothetical protein [Candidatus Pelagibacter sp.]
MKFEYTRNCPKCDKIISYKSKSTLYQSNRKNTNCKSCSNSGINNPNYGKVRTKQSIQKMVEVRKHNGSYVCSDETKKKLSKAHIGKIISKETKQKMSKSAMGRDMSGVNNPMFGKSGKDSPRFGKIHTIETKRKIRLSTLERIERMSGQLYPNYNPRACKIIDEYGKKHGYNFQHAENGGEHHIKELGYWVDGYDKDKNVVIEYDENYHNNIQKKDIQRQKEIEKYLGCEFIRIKEK